MFLMVCSAAHGKRLPRGACRDLRETNHEAHEWRRAFSLSSLHRQARLGLGVKGPLEELARARAPQEFVRFHDHAATR